MKLWVTSLIIGLCLWAFAAGAGFDDETLGRWGSWALLGAGTFLTVAGAVGIVLVRRGRRR